MERLHLNHVNQPMNHGCGTNGTLARCRIIKLTEGMSFEINLQNSKSLVDVLLFLFTSLYTT